MQDDVRIIGEDQQEPRSNFIRSSKELVVGDAVAAIILMDDGRYLLQLRDDIEPIWYPGHWGCFGGGVGLGEDPLDALRRELREELAYECCEATFFSELWFDLSGLQLGRYYRRYYVVHMSPDDMATLRLGEGAAVQAFDGDTMLETLKISPYDSFALFLHSRGNRIVSGM